jgi:hypothetical protein
MTRAATAHRRRDASRAARAPGRPSETSQIAEAEEAMRTGAMLSYFTARNVSLEYATPWL